MIKLSVPNSAKYMEGKILWGEKQRRSMKTFEQKNASQDASKEEFWAEVEVKEDMQASRCERRRRGQRQGLGENTWFTVAFSEGNNPEERKHTEINAR